MQTDNPTLNQTTPSPIESIPSKSPTPKKESSKWIAVSIITLLFGVIGVFAYQNYLLKQQIDYSKTTSSPKLSATNPSVVPSTTSTPDPTADWETYQNEEIGIMFKYPSWLGVPAVRQFDSSSQDSNEYDKGKLIYFCSYRRL